MRNADVHGDAPTALLPRPDALVPSPPAGPAPISSPLPTAETAADPADATDPAGAADLGGSGPADAAAADAHAPGRHRGGPGRDRFRVDPATGRDVVTLPWIGDVRLPRRQHLGTVVAASSLLPAAVATLRHDGHSFLDGRASATAGHGAAAGVPLAVGVTVDHLLARTTYGATPALRAEVAKAGASLWLAGQLSPATVPDPEGDAVLTGFPLLSMTPAEIQGLRRRRSGGGDVDPARDLQAAHVGRAMASRRQLLEVMVGFWSDHFTVPVTADRADLTRADYDARVIRRNALGRFEDLLVAVADHPAMMLYLNLAGSTRRDPNENFARELLELHTVGIDGGYGEADVKQAARLLTGMQVTDDVAVRYEPRDHYVGAVKVMTFRSSNASRARGRDVARVLYRYLAHHPSTARHLAVKLARRFVADDPPTALVDRLARVYLTADTRIVPVLTALFSSPEFAESTGKKRRRPMEFVVAATRATGVRPGADPDGLRDLVRSLDDVGHAPFAWTTPNGYPDVASAWQSAGQALGQWRILARLLTGRDEHGIGVADPAKLLADPAHALTADAITNQLARRYLGRPPTAPELAAVRLALPARAFPRTFRARTATQRRAVVNASYVLLHSTTFLTR